MEYEVRISEGIKPLAEWSVDMAEDYISLVAELVGMDLPDCTLRHDADRDTTAPRRIAVLAGGLPTVAPEVRHALPCVREIVAYAWQAVVDGAARYAKKDEVEERRSMRGERAKAARRPRAELMKRWGDPAQLRPSFSNPPGLQPAPTSITMRFDVIPPSLEGPQDGSACHTPNGCGGAWGGGQPEPFQPRGEGFEPSLTSTDKSPVPVI